MIDLKEVEQFFFKAMIEGWTAGGKKIVIPHMPNYKALPFRDGDFYLLDRYCVTTHGPKSAGTTTIWFQDAPIWLMNYGGYYEERAIKFLKAAIRKAYGAHQFFGGRGPLLFSEGSLVYVNQPRLNNFSKFEGREEVFDLETGGSLGWHEYWGLALI